MMNLFKSSNGIVFLGLALCSLMALLPSQMDACIDVEGYTANCPLDYDCCAMGLCCHYRNKSDTVPTVPLPKRLEEDSDPNSDNFDAPADADRGDPGQDYHGK